MLVHFAPYKACAILNFPTVSEMLFGCLDDVVCMFNMLNLLMMYEPYVYVKGFVH
jgi:hypothetical protein